jgi:hypothetical protein
MVSGRSPGDDEEDKPMATNPITSENSADAVPVACSLSSADLAAQASRWEQLATRALTERAETADGLRLCFQAEPGIEDELHKLADVENQCCPWATWMMRPGTREVVLEVRSTGEGIAVLHGMFTGLEPTRATR